MVVVGVRVAVGVAAVRAVVVAAAAGMGNEGGESGSTDQATSTSVAGEGADVPVASDHRQGPPDRAPAGR